MKSVELSLKLTGIKNKSILAILVHFPCLLCPSDGNGKTTIFDNIDSIIRHVRRNHNTHPMARRYKLSLKHLEFVINYMTPKNGDVN